MRRFHCEIVGYMSKGEAKNVIENKGKSNRIIGGMTRPRSAQWHAESYGD